MTIPPMLFELLFYIFVLALGIDFLISGLLIQREYSKHLEKPKLVGLRILKLNQGFFKKMRDQNQVYRFMYSSQGIKLLIISAGTLISIGSIIQIIDLLLRLST